MATTNVMRVYYETEAERDAVNAAYVLYYAPDMDMRLTWAWYPWGEDENGFYIDEPAE